MKSLFYWILENKLKFFAYDSIFTLLNISIVNYIQKRFFLDSEHVISFIAGGLLIAFLYMITRIWALISNKLYFLFIPAKVSIKALSFVCVIIFLSFNLLLIIFAWVNYDLINKSITFYFAMPWLIFFCASMYNLAIEDASVI